MAGGLRQLGGVFASLYARGQLGAALDEKRDGARAFAAMQAGARRLLALQPASAPRGVFFARKLLASAQYGAVLARIVEAGGRVMGLGYAGDRTGEYARPAEPARNPFPKRAPSLSERLPHTAGTTGRRSRRR
jgi:hypothetical protein